MLLLYKSASLHRLSFMIGCRVFASLIQVPNRLRKSAVLRWRSAKMWQMGDNQMSFGFTGEAVTPNWNENGATLNRLECQKELYHSYGSRLIAISPAFKSSFQNRMGYFKQTKKHAKGKGCLALTDKSKSSRNGTTETNVDELPLLLPSPYSLIHDVLERWWWGVQSNPLFSIDAWRTSLHRKYMRVPMGDFQSKC